MRRWVSAVLAVIPLLAGVGVWLAVRQGLLPADRFYVVAETGDWALAAGVVLTLVAVGVLLGLASRDRRWRRRAADQATASARERRLLLSRLDHELKNPLTAMRAATANVAAGPGEGWQAAVDSIEEQVLRLSRLTADLRKIADVESGRMDRGPVDLTELLEETVDFARDLPGADQRTLTVDLPRAPWPLPTVTGDGDLLSLAVGNLLDNALKYTPPGGRVEVRAREAAGHVVLEVADTGRGIEAEELPQVWEELYRSPSARAVPGSGLGLPLVRAVVERHGGTVHVESRLGSGTLVRVALPTAGERAAQAAV